MLWRFGPSELQRRYRLVNLPGSPPCLHPTAQFAGFGHSSNCNQIGCFPEMYFVALAHLVYACIGLGHSLIKPPVDLLQLPVKVVGILDLLEIRYCHSSRVGKGVRQYNYTLVVENEVGFGCSWSVCQFAADPALEICSVVGANHVFERCREK